MNDFALTSGSAFRRDRVRIVPGTPSDSAVGLVKIRGGISTTFGQWAYRPGGLQNRQAGAPLFFCMQEAADAPVGTKATLYVYFSDEDGPMLREAWRSPIGSDTAGLAGLTPVAGADAAGKVYGNLRFAQASNRTVIWDFAPIVDKALTAQPWQRLHTGQFNIRALGAGGGRGAMYEGGSLAPDTSTGGSRAPSTPSQLTTRSEGATASNGPSVSGSGQGQPTRTSPTGRLVSTR